METTYRLCRLFVSEDQAMIAFRYKEHHGIDCSLDEVFQHLFELGVKAQEELEPIWTEDTARMGWKAGAEIMHDGTPYFPRELNWPEEQS